MLPRRLIMVNNNAGGRHPFAFSTQNRHTQNGDLKFEWRLMYYIYVENNLRRHTHTKHDLTLLFADDDEAPPVDDRAGRCLGLLLRLRRH